VLQTFESWIGGLSDQLAQEPERCVRPVRGCSSSSRPACDVPDPCVYPMIPIVVRVHGGCGVGPPSPRAPARSRAGAAFWDARCSTSSGWRSSTTALGLAAILAGRTFGSLTQSFWGYAVVAARARRVRALAGSACSRSGSRRSCCSVSGSGPREGNLGALLMGATSAIVAAPVPPPRSFFRWPAMVAREGRVVFGTIAMLVFSLGLGVLSCCSGSARGLAASMPRPGPWMVTLEEAHRAR